MPQAKGDPWPCGPPPGGPAVVALGGGHGLAAALTAVRRYAGAITAVVSVADDGGSSGRLRRGPRRPRPGRPAQVPGGAGRRPTRCGGRRFEHRFRGGELDGHALGNLVIVGLAQALGDFGQALDEAGRLLECAGRVLPATTDPVVLTADAGDGAGRRSRARWRCRTRRTAIRRVHIVPEDAKAHPDVVERHRAGRPGRAGPRVAVHQPGCRCCASRPSARRWPPPGAGSSSLQPAAPGARDPRARRHRPPPGRARPRRPGRRLPLPPGRRWPPTRSRSGPSGSSRWRPTWPGPTGSSTTRPPWPRRSKGSCRLPGDVATALGPPRTGGRALRALGRDAARGRRRSMTVRVGINGFGRIGRSFYRAILARGAERRRRAGGGQRPVRRQRDDGLPAQARLRRRHAAERGQGDRRRLLGRRQRGPQAGGAATRPRSRGATTASTSSSSRPASSPPARRRPATSPAAPSGSSSRRRRATPTPRSAWASTTSVYDAAQHTVISNASCTTNCLAPMAKVLQRPRSASSRASSPRSTPTRRDQQLQDMATASRSRQARPAPHAGRRACRSSRTRPAPPRPSASCCPSSRAGSTACRCGCPTPTGSITDLVGRRCGADATDEEVNAAFAEAAGDAVVPGRAAVHRGAAGVGRHRRQPVVVHLLGRATRWSNGPDGEGARLVRQRVGLLEPPRRPRRLRRPSSRLSIGDACPQLEDLPARRGQPGPAAGRLQRPAATTARIDRRPAHPGRAADHRVAARARARRSSPARTSAGPRARPTRSTRWRRWPPGSASCSAVEVPLAPEVVGRAGVEPWPPASAPGEVADAREPALRAGRDEATTTLRSRRTWPSSADVYVNDAFGAAAPGPRLGRRPARGTCPSAAGRLLAARGRGARRGCSDVAGTGRSWPCSAASKVSDKIGVIDALLDRCDTLLVGGAMAFTFLVAQGYAVGDSLVELDQVDAVPQPPRHRPGVGPDRRRRRPGDRPTTPRRAGGGGRRHPRRVEGPRHRPGDRRRRTPPRSPGAATVFWNGPMGVFEMAPFAAGTRPVAEAVAGVRRLHGGRRRRQRRRRARSSASPSGVDHMSHRRRGVARVPRAGRPARPAGAAGREALMAG